MEIWPLETIQSIYKLPLSFLFSFLGGLLVSASVKFLISSRFTVALLIGLLGVVIVYISYTNLPLQSAPYLKWFSILFTISGFFRINIFAGQKHRY
jgi:hypothetical protein